VPGPEDADNVQILGRARSVSRRGTRTIETLSGEKAVVAVLPFASPGAWASTLDTISEEASSLGSDILFFAQA